MIHNEYPIKSVQFPHNMYFSNLQIQKMKHITDFILKIEEVNGDEKQTKYDNNTGVWGNVSERLGENAASAKFYLFRTIFVPPCPQFHTLSVQRLH